MARFTDETYLKEWRERQVLISSTEQSHNHSGNNVRTL